jgi:REP element-mobilizing transposase RayT
LPHWDQPGTFAFITFRLGDSLPAKCVAKFKNDRAILLREAGLDPSATDIRSEFAKLPPRDAAILQWKIFTAWDLQLGQLHGECYLRRRDASKIVAEGLLKFDGDRYVMAAFAILPNHVHVLAAFAEEGAVTSQGAAWRKYFARQINAILGRSGHLWQPDQFDHLIRTEVSFEHTRWYIIDNPREANLRSGEYRVYVSADW